MPTSLGLVGITNKGNYDAQTTYVKGNFVYYNGSTWLCISNTSVSNVEPTEVNNTTWKYLAKGFNVLPFGGATSSTDGTGGTVPQPHAGDEDKVLQGNGTFGKKLQIDVVIQNNQYGYIGANNTFIPFKSQADIDAAVSAAKVGDAVAGDVRSGKTFTNATTSGVVGTFAGQEKTVTATDSTIAVTPDSGKWLSKVTVNKISPQRSLGTAATGSGIDSTGPYVYMPYGWWPEYSGKAGSSYTYMTAAQAVNACPKQEKTVTAGTSAASVTPDSGKLLSKVTYNPTPSQSKSCTPSTSAQTIKPDSGKLLSQVSVSAISTQEKTVTASRSAQTVTPDSGKHLSKVTVNKYPDASGNYTCGSNDGTASSNDMGTTNNYRYVNASNVYNYGRARPNKYEGYVQVINPVKSTYGSTGAGIAIPNAKSVSIKYKWEQGAPKSGDTLTVIYTGDGWDKPTTYNLSGTTGGTTTVNPPTKSGQYVCYVNFELKHNNRDGSGGNAKVSYTITPSF